MLFGTGNLPLRFQLSFINCSREINGHTDGQTNKVSYRVASLQKYMDCYSICIGIIKFSDLLLINNHNIADFQLS